MFSVTFNIYFKHCYLTKYFHKSISKDMPSKSSSRKISKTVMNTLKYKLGEYISGKKLHMTLCQPKLQTCSFLLFMVYNGSKMETLSEWGLKCRTRIHWPLALFQHTILYYKYYTRFAYNLTVNVMWRKGVKKYC